jgi:hypothetical protein
LREGEGKKKEEKREMTTKIKLKIHFSYVPLLVKKNTKKNLITPQKNIFDCQNQPHILSKYNEVVDACPTRDIVFF